MIVGSLNALSKEAITSGNSVYPIIQIAWKKDLYQNVSVGDSTKETGKILHISAKKFNLKGNNRFTCPYNRKNARKYCRALLRFRPV